MAALLGMSRLAAAAAAAALLVLAAVASAQVPAEQQPPFKYNGGGNDWPGLCAADFLQSPIDVELPAGEGGLDSVELRFHYPVVHPWQSRVAMHHDGARLLLNVSSGDDALGFLLKNGVRYPVVRVEFHAPSEHRIRGQQFAMEMQVYHQRQGAAENEDLVVVAAVFDAPDAKTPDNKFLRDALQWEHLPGEQGSRRDLTAPFQLGMALEGLHCGYFQYTGSLTSPPCSAQVQWNLLETVQYMSFKQRYAIDQLFRLNPAFAQNHGNNREARALKGRLVELHNHKQQGDGDGRLPLPRIEPQQEANPGKGPAGKGQAEQPEAYNASQVKIERELDQNRPKAQPELYRLNGADWSGACKNGREQSPIDIVLNTGNPHGDFEMVPEYSEVLVRTVDHKGFALALEPPRSPGVLTVDGVEYYLYLITFHTPSEHTIDGRRADMEMQLVHRRAQPSQLAGRPFDYAVLSVLFRNGAYTAHPLLSDIGLSLPTAPGSSMPINGGKGMMLNLNKIRGLGLGYYSYAGSLSWPPCTEGTRRFVLRTIQDMSTPQLSAWTSAVKNNFRALQPLNSRGVTVHNVNEHVEIIPPTRPHLSDEALLPL